MTKPANTAKDPALVQFGSEMRQCRERAGKRGVDLAEEIDISNRHLGRIERGEVRASNAVYWRIAQVLNIDPSNVIREQVAS